MLVEVLVDVDVAGEVSIGGNPPQSAMPPFSQGGSTLPVGFPSVTATTTDGKAVLMPTMVIVDNPAMPLDELLASAPAAPPVP